MTRSTVQRSTFQRSAFHLLALTVLLLSSVSAAAEWQLVDPRQVRDLHVLPGEPPVLLATSGDVLVKLALPGGEWSEIEVPLPGPSTSGDVEIVPVSFDLAGLWVAPRAPEVLYANFIYDYEVYGNGELVATDRAGRLWFSGDGGETWGDAGEGGQTLPLAVSPRRPSLIYLVSTAARRHPGPPQLLRTSVPHRTSDLLAVDSDPVPFSSSSELAVDAVNPFRVYLASGGSVYVNADLAETWDEHALPAAATALEAHPVLGRVAVVGTADGGLQRSLDGGSTWSPLSSPGSGPVEELAWDPLRRDRFYAVVDGVPHATDDGGATWTGLGAGLPGDARVSELVVDPADPSRLFAVLAEGGVWVLDRTLSVACVPDAVTLCLGEGDRYEVRVQWQDFELRAGMGRVVPLAFEADGVADTGAFWFFDEENLELVVKVLDGTSVNGFRWVFYGSLTNVPFTLAVTDTETGEAIGYYNPARRFASRGDTTAFPDQGYGTVPPAGVVSEPVVTQVAPAPCAAGPTVHCLGEGRFEVRVEWTGPRGATGAGTAVPATDDTGLFWFSRASNLELAVKVLDGRGVNDHHWVFYGSLTDVAFELTVTDTLTGRRLLYENPPENLASRGDTAAFPAED